MKKAPKKRKKKKEKEKEKKEKNYQKREKRKKVPKKRKKRKNVNKEQVTMGGFATKSPKDISGEGRGEGYNCSGMYDLYAYTRGGGKKRWGGGDNAKT